MLFFILSKLSNTKGLQNYSICNSDAGSASKRPTQPRWCLGFSEFKPSQQRTQPQSTARPSKPKVRTLTSVGEVSLLGFFEMSERIGSDNTVCIFKFGNRGTESRIGIQSFRWRIKFGPVIESILC